MKLCAGAWTVTLQLNVTEGGVEGGGGRRLRVPKQNVTQKEHENVCHICRKRGNGRRCQVIWPTSTSPEGEVVDDLRTLEARTGTENNFFIFYQLQRGKDEINFSN